MDGFFKVNEIPPNYSELKAIQNKAKDIEFDFNIFKTELDMYHLCCSILEKANSRFIYLRRQKIITMYTKNIHDSKNKIQDLTDGVSVELYLSKYLP